MFNSVQLIKLLNITASLILLVCTTIRSLGAHKTIQPRHVIKSTFQTMFNLKMQPCVPNQYVHEQADTIVLFKRTHFAHLYFYLSKINHFVSYRQCKIVNLLLSNKVLLVWFGYR